MRRIALTGATGFLGGRVATALDEREGLDVVEIGRRPSGPEADFVEFDLASTDPDRLSDLGADTMLHFAAHVPEGNDAERRARSEAVNGGGAIRLFEACRGASVERLVVAGSCHLRDPSKPELIADFYEGSKLAAERYLSVLSAFHELSFAVLRLPYLYGAGMHHGRLFELLVSRARAGERIEIHHGGLAQIRLLHVDDAVRAFLRALDPDRKAEGVLNVAPRRPTRVAEVARAVVEALGSTSEVVPVGDPAEAPPVRLLDPPPEKTVRQLDWTPRVTLDRGIVELVDGATGSGAESA